MITFILIIIGLILVVLNAFFVAAEFAMVKLRPTRVAVIATQYPWRGVILAKVHKQLDAYLSACQLGITLASLGLGWVGEPALADLISPILNTLGLTAPGLIEFISFTFAFTFLSFLHIVIGELLPKSWAIRQSEQIALWTAIPLYSFHWFMYPIIWLLNSCSNFFLKKLHLDEVHPGEVSHSSEELKLILRSSQLHGELTSQESSILAHTLELAELQAIDVMCSVHDMVMLNSEITKKDLLNTLNRYRYSRYPVYNQQEKKIIGLLHVKDLQPTLNAKNDELLHLQSLTRPIPQISYRLPALTLLRQFQSGMPHFALVCNRRGDVAGFVTLDNLLHLVIGVIKDEFHKTGDAWLRHPDGSLTVKGNCPVFALERALQKELNLSTEQEEITTVGGLILHQLGAVPIIGQQVEFSDFIAVIETMDGARIMQIKIFPKHETLNDLEG
ncbi:hemolysin family protein [Legionella sp. D16C41]|uniref:hemolysin family protein n=1 Tax=Legionella sp. D16C41 TaxID=3402688 RepID=UPI003AF565AB